MDRDFAAMVEALARAGRTNRRVLRPPLWRRQYATLEDFVADPWPADQVLVLRRTRDEG